MRFCTLAILLTVVLATHAKPMPSLTLPKSASRIENRQTFCSEGAELCPASEGGGCCPEPFRCCGRQTECCAGKCFPSGARVLLRDGSQRRMDSLEVGDEVMVGENEYSKVFMFTHREKRFEGAGYVRLEVAGGRSVTAATGHLVYVCERGEGCRKKTVVVEQVKLGDEVPVVGEGKAAVVGVRAVEDQGLYNPQTLQGDLVVEGVVVSTYTTAVQYEVAHSSLAPLRAVHRLLSGVCSTMSG